MEKKTPKAFIVHHEADADGRLSGLVAAMNFIDKGYDVVPIGWDYWMDPSNLIYILDNSRTGEEDVLVMTDISLKLEYMESLLVSSVHEFADFIWIDHHKTAIEELECLNLTGLRVDGTAACELAWEFFYNSKIPYAIELAGQYDVWRKNGKFDWDRFVIPFQYFLKSIDLKIDAKGSGVVERISDSVFNCDIDRYAIPAGELIMSFAKKEAEKAKFFEVEFEGIKFLAVNQIGGSTLFEFAGKSGDSLMAFSYVGRDKVKFSMYEGNVPTDLSVIAKKWGGGGHAKACGFEVQSNQANSIFKGVFKK